MIKIFQNLTKKTFGAFCKYIFVKKDFKDTMLGIIKNSALLSIADDDDITTIEDW